MAFALSAANKGAMRKHDVDEDAMHDGADGHNGPFNKAIKKKPKTPLRISPSIKKRPESASNYPLWVFRRAAHLCNVLTSTSTFQNFITFVILVASALVGIQTYPSMEGRQALTIMDAVVLYIFTAECVLKIVACGTKPWEYIWFKGGPEFWNIFDFVVVVVCYLPLGAGMVTVIRLFRLLRVLKLVKALPELQVLVMGLIGSLSSIFYVALLLMLVFYLYGIMCVSFFRDNDPVHFGSLETAFLTLFRMSTFEDWTDVMYTQLYGCDVYPYHFRQWWCKTPQKAMGWVAAPFFVSFIILSSLVVLNLFIGVIISNMNDARATLQKEDNAAPEPDDPDEFQQDGMIMSDMLKKIENLSDSIAQVRDSMEDMQTHVQKLENSARTRINKVRKSDASMHGLHRAISQYATASNRIKRGLAKTSAIAAFATSIRGAKKPNVDDSDVESSTHINGVP